MDLFSKFLYSPQTTTHQTPNIIKKLIQEDVEYLERDYKNILEKPIYTLRISKTVPELFKNDLERVDYLNEKPTTLQEFYQTRYKPFLQNRLDIFSKKYNSLFTRDVLGFSFFYYLFVLFPQFEPIFGSTKTLKKYKNTFFLYMFYINGIPRISLEKPRFYLFTDQSQFHSYFSPGSASLTQFQNNLTRSQKQFLKKRHQDTKIDKPYYTGSYGVYFQLVYKPLSWFTPIKSNLKTETRFVYDAESLLNKILREMKENKISSKMIYFNPGWFFGRQDQRTIVMGDNVGTFFTNVSPFLENRNEVVIRWIVPCSFEYGLVATTKSLR